MGRSMTLEVRIAFSEAFPSLLLNPPGIFPHSVKLLLILYA